MGLIKTVVVAGTGAALAYFLDPENGRARRARMQRAYEDKVGARMAMSYPEEAEQPNPIVVPNEPARTGTSH